MDIYLTDLETGDRVVFPMLPEKVNVQTGAMFQTYTIPSVGEIRLPNGQNLSSFSWNGILPGKARTGASYVNDWQSPHDIEARWNVFRTQRKKLRLQVTETPVDMHVYLERYNMEYSGGYGDFTYDISFVETKPLKVNISGSNACEPRPSPPPQKTYTVVPGDCLWKIANRFYGSGAKYPIIYEANKTIIGSDPNKIYPGQVFIIP